MIAPRNEKLDGSVPFETVEFPEQPATPEEVGRYYTDCKERIAAGDSVWMQRTFDTDSGRVLDWYRDGEHKGFIEEDFSGMECDAYLIPSDSPDRVPILANTGDERLLFQEAAAVLQLAVNNREREL